MDKKKYDKEYKGRAFTVPTSSYAPLIKYYLGEYTTERYGDNQVILQWENGSGKQETNYGIKCLMDKFHSGVWVLEKNKSIELITIN